jgi:hypothetical protein
MELIRLLIQDSIEFLDKHPPNLPKLDFHFQFKVEYLILADGRQTI